MVVSESDVLVVGSGWFAYVAAPLIPESLSALPAEALLLLGVGVGIYAVLNAFFPRQVRHQITWIHELTHAFVARCFGYRVAQILVYESGEGRAAYCGREHGMFRRILISLAPYCFPVYHLLCLLVVYALEALLLPYGSTVFALGALGALYFHSVWIDFGPHQPDTHAAGWLFSCLIVVATNLAVAGAALAFLVEIS